MSLDNHMLRPGPATGPVPIIRHGGSHRRATSGVDLRRLIPTGRARHVLPRPHRWSLKMRARVTGMASGAFLALLVAVAMVVAVTG